MHDVSKVNICDHEFCHNRAALALHNNNSIANIDSRFNNVNNKINYNTLIINANRSITIAICNCVEETVDKVEGKGSGHSENKNNAQRGRESKASLVCAILTRRQENKRRMR